MGGFRDQYLAAQVEREGETDGERESTIWQCSYAVRFSYAYLFSQIYLRDKTLVPIVIDIIISTAISNCIQISV